MTYNLTYDYAAVAVLTCILTINLFSKNIRLWHNRRFLAVTVTTLIATIFDILSVFSIKYGENLPLGILKLTSNGYFIFTNSISFLYAMYIYSAKSNGIIKLTKKDTYLLYTPIILIYLIILTNFIHHGIFYYDSNKTYNSGKYQFILYILSFYYLMYAVLFTAFCRKELPTKYKVSIYLFVIIGFGSYVVQFVYRDLLISNFAVSICLLLSLLAVHKPDTGIDTRIGTLNSSAFSDAFELMLARNTTSNLFLLYVEEVEFMYQTLGIKTVDGYLASIGSFLESISNKNAYYISANVFAVIITSASARAAQHFIDSVEKRFDESWECNGSSIMISCRLLELKVPEDAENMEAVYAYRDYIKNISHESPWYIRAKDTNFSLSKRQVAVEAAIKRAIEEDNFEVYYQPIYSTRDKRITSAEALLRLKDPELGFIPPDEFITIAEKTGDIVKIGELVFEKVCVFIKNNFEGTGLEYIEINLSVIQCLQDNLTERLTSIMKQHGIDSSKINLEITETAATTSPKTLVKNMNRLHNKGLSFSLDDYGTGYSNMSSTVQLPLNIIKLDKTLIDTANSQKGNIAFRSSVAMIKQMNMKIVAEGIETAEQVEMMEKEGIEYLQGFYFSKPVPERDFLEYINNFNNNQ